MGCVKSWREVAQDCIERMDSEEEQLIRIPASASLFKIERLALTLLWQWCTLVLDIGAKIRLNYFGLINVPDCPASAATICCLYTVSALSTTAATALSSLPLSITVFLSFSDAVRVSVCQMMGIRAPVWFIKLVLEKQKKKKKEKKKKKKKK
ncbi:conserved hypothetical protein [Coccidioides posadasii str. Silveira]|uniref:Uncharacterized protein n=1 Tax=Coccidioides posadasii (strain RMSCC 757 / Silveira) TaxID=443226 RepID=E9DIJ2_COCPS|nr:conserved hypothetical protein [Coccidioides posadasii str. Silveira]